MRQKREVARGRSKVDETLFELVKFGADPSSVSRALVGLLWVLGSSPGRHNRQFFPLKFQVFLKNIFEINYAFQIWMILGLFSLARKDRERTMSGPMAGA